METKFTTLVFGNANSFIYIDVNRLSKGLYASNKPTLYDKDATLGNIWGGYKTVLRMLNAPEEPFKENLYKCRLVEFNGTINWN